MRLMTISFFSLMLAGDPIAFVFFKDLNSTRKASEKSLILSRFRDHHYYLRRAYSEFCESIRFPPIFPPILVDPIPSVFLR